MRMRIKLYNVLLWWRNQLNLFKIQSEDKTLYFIAFSSFILNLSSFILHSLFFIIHSSFFIFHYLFFILHSSFFILHSSFFILHPSSFILHQSSFHLPFSYFCPLLFSYYSLMFVLSLFLFTWFYSTVSSSLEFSLFLFHYL